MAESTDPTSRSPAPEELHWGISYLREDIQDLRQDLRQQISAVHNRIDETNKRIDETNKCIDLHFRWLMTTLVAVAGVIIAVIKL